MSLRPDAQMLSEPPVFGKVLVSERVKGQWVASWFVDGRQLSTATVRLVSSQFQLKIPGCGSVPFKVVLQATEVCNRSKGGFRRAKGTGSIALKCEADDARPYPKLHISFHVGMGAQQQPPRSVTHEFTEQSCCCLSEAEKEWDLRMSVDEETSALLVSICISMADVIAPRKTQPRSALERYLDGEASESEDEVSTGPSSAEEPREDGENSWSERQAMHLLLEELLEEPEECLAPPGLEHPDDVVSTSPGAHKKKRCFCQRRSCCTSKHSCGDLWNDFWDAGPSSHREVMATWTDRCQYFDISDEASLAKPSLSQDVITPVEDLLPAESQQPPVTEHAVGQMSNPCAWGVAEVAGWMAAAEKGKFRRYADIFRSNEIDGPTLRSLTKDELKDELEVKELGIRKALLAAIQQLFTA
mmetsp:Transcript_44690/g.83442  ORF Transcript_44690/g.83442 Transcript_44690/m.83442 type:complete len:415 (-) Transcript_44690:203-1447(-)